MKKHIWGIKQISRFLNKNRAPEHVYRKWESEQFRVEEFRKKIGFEEIKDNSKTSDWPDYVIRKDGRLINLEVVQLSIANGPVRAFNQEGRKLCGELNKLIKGKWYITIKYPLEIAKYKREIADELQQMVANYNPAQIQFGKYIGWISHIHNMENGMLLFNDVFETVTADTIQKQVIKKKSEKIRDKTKPNWLLITLHNLHDKRILDVDYNFCGFSEIYCIDDYWPPTQDYPVIKLKKGELRK